LFSPAGAVVAGSGAPNGRAERVLNGYRASGRWSYASGASYATILTANCVVTSNGIPVLDGRAKPVIRAMCFSPANVTVSRSWNATGMRGTGSHDIEVREVFVPEEHSFSVLTDAAREPGPLYRLPFEVLTQLPVAAVASGIARHALDACADLIAQKTAAGNRTPLAEIESVRSQYAQNHARWLSVHLALHALGSRTWETALSGTSLTARELAEIAASCAHFVSELQSAVAGIARIAGMNAVLHDSPLARAWRDLQTLAAHASVSALLYGQAGTALLPGTGASCVPGAVFG
jgi:alkylation response protein AidB-like acyl-CoA dehydrogenase